jgi:5-oxopent-3-ene-1,2,5-tricarboxylate decarboxylase/2-hydroxyhepta-2,4-diene-1,7-dioate isomerase
MSVLEGPRWEVVHLPPCDPTKIICVHVNYISRYYEFIA